MNIIDCNKNLFAQKKIKKVKLGQTKKKNNVSKEKFK